MCNIKQWIFSQNSSIDYFVTVEVNVWNEVEMWEINVLHLLHLNNYPDHTSAVSPSVTMGSSSLNYGTTGIFDIVKIYHSSGLLCHF